jgi:hypothetical protein
MFPINGLMVNTFGLNLIVHFMKKNMGTADRVLRILIAVAIIAIYFFTNLLSGTVALILLIASGIFIATSFISFCPLYLPFGISTVGRKKQAQ